MRADGWGFSPYITGMIAVLLAGGTVAIIGCDSSITLTELGDGLDDLGPGPSPVIVGGPDLAGAGPVDTLFAPASLDDETAAGPSIIATPSRTLAGVWEFRVAIDGRESMEGLRFVWDFGNEQQRAGPEPSYSFATSGLHRVTVTVFERVDTVAFILTMDVAVPDGDTPPIADAGRDQTVDADALVTLDGGGSVAPRGGALRYWWRQTSGEPVVIQDASAAIARFVAPTVDTETALDFTLTVSDGRADGSDSVKIHVSPVFGAASLGLVADAGADLVVTEGTTVTLDAAGSSMSGDGSIRYEWSQISGPTVALADEGDFLATFVAPEVDELTIYLVFEVVVTEGEVTSGDRVVISVTGETLSPTVDDLAVGAARSFRMGLTPFAEVTDDASEQRVWDFVRDHGDLAAIHIDPIGGLPWEALEQGNVPSALRADFEGIALRLPSDRPVYVAINPLNTGRDGVAGNRSGGPFPATMGPADFANPRLHQAFINYARFVVETLEPTYLAVGIEVNMYALAPGADFASLVALYKDVYHDLRAAHPDLIIFATFQTEFMNGFDQWRILNQFEPELDRVGLALYPSGVGYRPEEIPDDWISIVRSVTDVPIVITETGYGTQPFVGTGFTAPGSEELQRDYVQWLVDQADGLALDFVVWFFPGDVPDLVATDSTLALMPEFDNISFFFHMGLIRSDFSERASLDLWTENLSRPLQP